MDKKDDVNKNLRNLGNYIVNDPYFSKTEKIQSDFDSFCYNHCLDIQKALQALDSEKELKYAMCYFIQKNIIYSIKDIKIQKNFLKHSPNPGKMRQKVEYLMKNNYYKDSIIINEEGFLIDGYTTYILCHFYNILPTVYVEESFFKRHIKVGVKWE